MIRQIINIRTNITKRFKSLKGGHIDKVLDKTGKIVQISELITYNKE